MNTLKKYLPAALWGILYAAAVVFLSRWLLSGLGDLVERFGEAAGLEQELTAHISLALGQLKDAQLHSPWLWGLLIGAVAGMLLRWLISSRITRIVIGIAAGLLMLAPLTLATVWFTQVNDISVGTLLQSLLPLVSALL